MPGTQSQNMFPRNNFDMTETKLISGVQDVNNRAQSPDLNYFEKVRLNSPKSRKALGSLTAVKNNQFTPGLVSPGQLVSSSIEQKHLRHLNHYVKTNMAAPRLQQKQNKKAMLSSLAGMGLGGQ